jgi:hypothetical protein
MARPQIIANGGSPGVKASVADDTLVTLTLDSLVGVRSIQWQILSTDETGSVGDYPLTIAGSIGQQAEFTSGALGTAVIVQVMVNSGLVRGVFNANETINTIKVFVPTNDGLEVGATGETYESDPEHGTTGILNGAIRLLNSFSVSVDGAPAKFADVVSTANLALSGAPIIDGVSVVDEQVVLAVGQTAPEENGLYGVVTSGDWTRPSYHDSEDEIRGSVVYVVLGSTGAGRIYQNTNTAAVVVGTTALTFARLPDRADKAILDAATSTPTLNTIAKWDAGARMNANAFVGPGLTSTLGVVRAAYNGTIVSALDSTGLVNLSILSTTTVDRAQLGSTACAGANVMAGSSGDVTLNVGTCDLVVTNDGVALGATPDFAAGQRVVFIPTATSTPGPTPPAGGGILYVDNGGVDLWFFGSDGTFTKLAP